MTVTAHYLSVDGPPLRLIGQIIRGGIELIPQPTYGRVLFTSHDAEIRNCLFLPDESQMTNVAITYTEIR